MNLKSKRILITAGPTWVPLDSVRVISNLASGETGILLAQQAARLGAKVTLVLGPVGGVNLKAGVRVIRFSFFDELRELLSRELSRGYDIVIHSAAVADYKPRASHRFKVRSGKNKWLLELVPLPKIIDAIRKIDPSLFVVGFKFKPSASKEALFREARKLMRRATLDLVVANTCRGAGYQAYILGKDKAYGPVFRKKNLAVKLFNAIREN